VRLHLKRKKNVTTIGTFDSELQVASAHDTTSDLYGLLMRAYGT